MAAAQGTARASLVARTASGSAYERMRAEALDIEAGVAASEGPARRVARRLHLPPPSRWLSLLRALFHAETRVLSRVEVEAHLDDCARPFSAARALFASRVAVLADCELLAMLDLYLELVPEPMAALRSGGAAAAAEARQLREGARSSDPSPRSDEEDDADVQAMLLENVLVSLAKALHSAGSPVWRLEFNLAHCARGLGLPGTQFAVFPSFILVTFSRLLSRGHGGKTLYIPTSPGLNMRKLDDVDALARRVAAYATNTPTPFREKAADDAAAAAAAVAALCCGREMRRRGAELRQRFCADAGGGGAPALGRAILELASSGPGFFMYSKHLGGSASGVDETEDEGWGDGASRGNSLYNGNDVAPAASSGSVMPPAESPTTPAAAHSHSPQEPPTQRSAPGSPRRHARYHRRRNAFLALALDDALEALRVIDAAKPLYPGWVQVASFAVSSAGCALAFFAGGWWDALLAGVLGGLVGAMGNVASVAGTRFVRAYEFLAAAMTAALARMADSALRPACLQAVMLSALIWLVQGWTMTNAIVELATRNPISGTSHLFVGVVTTAMLGFGLDAGSALAEILGAAAPSAQSPGACGAGVSAAAYVPLFVPTTLSFSLLLNADRSQLGIMTLLACVAFGASTACALAPRAQQLAPFLSAAVVGVGGNAYANATGRPAMAGTMSGIFILVPGAMALRSVATSLLTDADAGGGSGPVGLALTSRVLTVAVSIGAGLFMASLILPPRELLHVRNKAHRRAAQAAGAAVRMHGGYTRIMSAPVNM